MKRILSALLALTLILSLAPVALAANDEANDAAQLLYELGLFQGTATNADGSPVFDLDRAPTRNEAVTMLVRLLGKEEQAQNSTWNIPFTDVPEWAEPYVGYAYANGFTNGTSETTYSGDNYVSATQYITFVLRALGYTSGTDFQWDSAWELSDEIGLTNGEYNASTTTFSRGDVAIISYNALYTHIKGESTTLLDVVNKEPVATDDKLQGVWSRNNNGWHTEIIFDGNTFKEIEYSQSYNLFYYRIGTYILNDDILSMSYDEYSGMEPDGTELSASNFHEDQTQEYVITLLTEDTFNFTQTIVVNYTGETANLKYEYVRVPSSELDLMFTPIIEEYSEKHGDESGAGTDYSYLAAADFRRVQRQYSQATPRIAYYIAYTNLDGDLCVLTDVYYSIIGNFNEVTLHNITDGTYISNPERYYQERAERGYGNSALYYYDCLEEVLTQHLNALESGNVVSAEQLVA